MVASGSSVSSLFHDLAAKYEASTGGCTRQIATHLISLLPPIDADSTVLDNACGNGIAAQEVLYKYPDTALSMTCVDSAKPMVDLARHAVPASISSSDSTAPKPTLSFDVLDGVDLSPLPSASFSHSITNMGIFFFSDPVRGAQEIYRTLKPSGTAIVTSWESPGYLPVIHAAQRAVRPSDPLFKWPIADEWYDASHLHETLEKAGFAQIEMHDMIAYYASSSLEEACGYLFAMWKQIGPKWTEEENAEFKKQLLIQGRKVAVTTKRPVNGKKDAEIVEVVGFPMVAHVAIAKK
jgi:ubiquinone/menaquinone biosynthesis C-methylase UbiE